MKTLHLYLTRQVLATLLLTVAVFTFVLLLANVLREILGLLVNRQATPLLAFEAVALLIPFVLVFALPMGLLTAALLVFGRFSADQELTAVRAGGISLVALLAPILWLSFALSGVCTFINMEVAPPCRVAFKKLLFAVGINRASAGLPENTFITDFPGRIVYIRKVNGPLLKDITIYNLEGEKVESYIRAAGGEIHLDRTNNVINLQLTDAWRVRLLAEGRRVSEPFYATQTQLSYTNKPRNSPPTNTGRKCARWSKSGPTLPSRCECRSIGRWHFRLPAWGSRWLAFRWEFAPIAAKPPPALPWRWCWCWSITAFSSWARPWRRGPNGSRT